MSSFQKVIKYIAIAFAALIIFNIISGIVSGVSVLSGIFSNDVNNNLNKLDVDNNYRVLDIEVGSVNILIKKGKRFKVETDSDNISFKEVGSKLLITEKESSFLPKKVKNDLVIYIPDSYVFDEISIENGAGRVDVDYISADELELDLGAGKVNINKLNVNNEVSIDGGAGEIVVESGLVKNLDLDMGVGRVELNLEIVGTSEIDAGVGEVDLTLLNNSDSYKININKGIGEIVVDGRKMSDNSYYGSGENVINVDGGVGNINIDFEEIN